MKTDQAYRIVINREETQYLNVCLILSFLMQKLKTENGLKCRISLIIDLILMFNEMEGGVGGGGGVRGS